MPEPKEQPKPRYVYMPLWPSSYTGLNTGYPIGLYKVKVMPIKTPPPYPPLSGLSGNGHAIKERG